MQKTQLFFQSLYVTLYFLVASLIPFVALLVDVIYFRNAVGEESAVEYCQDIFLVILSVLFFRQAHKHPEARSGFLLMGFFFLTMLIREMDNIFDALIYHGSWSLLAAPLATFAVVYALLNKTETLNALTDFTQSKEFYSFIIGLLLVLVISRLIGMSWLWRSIFYYTYPRIVKNIAEEYTELLGYAIMCFSCVKYIRGKA
ncbi:hypothetical protein CBG46_05425 [Actinobacillus succinogenes]|uniref:Uncharacterized protein n=1 Tax=Actinobacillus succinogenes (strain ATCC 55618 / DSM 22257 / CCUG 43843 / 130Z) TaxID=339671 RepID=A6VK89_ACTSZ|nr:hypothetical protein [Actinobacillus succinogenes]ABR73386.1 conserved hypothetical protein [Actinobacillus succinogenes 130Z]PHI40147.1 hypothetical protein CBG46_05425 [Actinobacillus succinogenes]